VRKWREGYAVILATAPIYSHPDTLSSGLRVLISSSTLPEIDSYLQKVKFILKASTHPIISQWHLPIQAISPTVPPKKSARSQQKAVVPLTEVADQPAQRRQRVRIFPATGTQGTLPTDPKKRSGKSQQWAVVLRTAEGVQQLKSRSPGMETLGTLPIDRRRKSERLLRRAVGRRMVAEMVILLMRILREVATLATLPTDRRRRFERLGRRAAILDLCLERRYLEVALGGTFVSRF
jgi:hypothetical protein